MERKKQRSKEKERKRGFDMEPQRSEHRGHRDWESN
jgi:hypothetical protein